MRQEVPRKDKPLLLAKLQFIQTEADLFCIIKGELLLPQGSALYRISSTTFPRETDGFAAGFYSRQMCGPPQQKDAQRFLLFTAIGCKTIRSHTFARPKKVEPNSELLNTFRCKCHGHEATVALTHKDASHFCAFCQSLGENLWGVGVGWGGAVQLYI